MDFASTPEEDAVCQRMAALGRQVGEQPEEERMAALAGAGVLGLSVRRDHGGQGETLVTTARAFEALGRSLDDGGLLLAAGAHLFGVAMTIEHVGTDAQRRRWLPQLASGACVATVAATEAGAGSDVGSVAATVTEEGGTFLARGTPAGGFVRISARVGEDGGMDLMVSDNGIGIADEDIPRALERFGQVADVMTRKHSGTGLGLPLAIGMIELHGGRLEITSEVGTGTTVTVKFPPDRTVDAKGADFGKQNA